MLLIRVNEYNIGLAHFFLLFFILQSGEGQCRYAGTEWTAICGPLCIGFRLGRFTKWKMCISNAHYRLT